MAALTLAEAEEIVAAALIRANTSEPNARSVARALGVDTTYNRSKGWLSYLDYCGRVHAFALRRVRQHVAQRIWIDSKALDQPCGITAGLSQKRQRNMLRPDKVVPKRTCALGGIRQLAHKRNRRQSVVRRFHRRVVVGRTLWLSERGPQSVCMNAKFSQHYSGQTVLFGCKSNQQAPIGGSSAALIFVRGRNSNGRSDARRDVQLAVQQRKTFSNRRRLVGGFYAYDTVTETNDSNGQNRNVDLHFHDKETLLTRLIEWMTRESIEREAAILEHLASVEQVAVQISDQLTLRYFSHVYEPAHVLSVRRWAW